jgi:hypothetical protein
MKVGTPTVSSIPFPSPNESPPELYPTDSSNSSELQAWRLRQESCAARAGGGIAPLFLSPQAPGPSNWQQRSGAEGAEGAEACH